MLPQQLASVTAPEASTSEYNLVENISVRRNLTAPQSTVHACYHLLPYGRHSQIQAGHELCSCFVQSIISLAGESAELAGRPNIA